MVGTVGWTHWAAHMLGSRCPRDKQPGNDSWLQTCEWVSREVWAGGTTWGLLALITEMGRIGQRKRTPCRALGDTEMLTEEGEDQRPTQERKRERPGEQGGRPGQADDDDGLEAGR